jgi:hypothetical protein
MLLNIAASAERDDCSRERCAREKYSESSHFIFFLRVQLPGGFELRVLQPNRES